MKVGDKVKVIKLLNDQGVKITPIPEIVNRIGIIKCIFHKIKFPYGVKLRQHDVELVYFRKKELKKIK